MIPTEAISKTDFDRQEKGLPLIPRVREVKPDPIPPVVPDELKFNDLPEGEIYEFSARRRVEKNETETRFTGYTIYLETRKGKTIEGWLPEGEFEKLRQRIRVERPDLLSKIGL